MLVYDFIEIARPFDLVVRMLSSAEDEFQVWASAAFQRGEELAVGPRSAVSAPIELQLGEPIAGLETVTIPMSWIASSVTRLFPRMDAEVVVSPLGASSSHLEFRGSYRPPLDGVGRLLDRLALHRVAESTVRNFLERLSEAVFVETGVVAPNPTISPEARP